MKLLKTILSLVVLAVFSTLAHAADTYPLTNCVVSGEALGAMGEPVVINCDGTQVRLCCKAFIKKFNADPSKYLEKLNGKPSQG
jgi:hypothetical protein